MKRKNSFNRKEAEVSMEYILKIILGLLVLVGVFYFLFGNSIWTYVRNLPGHNYDNKDPPIKNISKDDQILAKYYKVAVILDGKYIKLCTAGDCSNLRDTKIYLYGDERKGDIYTDINWAFDKKVGAILNSKLVIDKDIFSGTGVYDKVKNDIPSYSDLRNLDNSIYISGMFLREKEYITAADESIFGTKFSHMDKDDNSFLEKANAVEDGNVLIVNMVYSINNFEVTEVQLERVGDNFKVFVTYTDSSSNVQSHLLDCNKNGWTWQTKYLSAASLSQTLKETLDANCKW